MSRSQRTQKSSTTPEKETGNPASLATLSKHLGLSMAAISRVLNGAPAAKSIPAATQERIFEAARQFDYRPNLLARGLRRGRSMTMGVLVPELSEGYASLVLAGLEETLSQSGYMFFVITHHHRADTLQRSQAMFTDRAVDGIVAIDTNLPLAGIVPTVTVSCPDPHEGVTNIVIHHERVAELALAHLHGLGHRDIAFIRGQPFSSDSEPRWKAIVSAADKLGLMVRGELTATLHGDTPTHDPGYVATQSLLATGAGFSALFAFNDVSAIGAIRALREAGRRVPQDVSVVGIDDIRSAAYQNPSLTTVRQPLHRMGVLAAETLLRQVMEPQSAPPEEPGQTPAVRRRGGNLVVEPELLVRESTAPAAR